MASVRNFEKPKFLTEAKIADKVSYTRNSGAVHGACLFVFLTEVKIHTTQVQCMGHACLFFLTEDKGYDSNSSLHGNPKTFLVPAANIDDENKIS